LCRIIRCKQQQQLRSC